MIVNYRNNKFVLEQTVAGAARITLNDMESAITAGFLVVSPDTPNYTDLFTIKDCVKKAIDEHDGKQISITALVPFFNNLQITKQKKEVKPMNSTNKIVVARIRKSLLEDILAHNDDTDTQYTPQEVMTSFDNWYGEYERRRTPNRQDAFVEWLRCLPSELDQPYADHEIEELLHMWLAGVPNNRKRPLTSDELWAKMGWLIYRELNKMIKEAAKDA